MDTNIFKKYFYLSLIEHSPIFNGHKVKISRLFQKKIVSLQFVV